MSIGPPTLYLLQLATQVPVDLHFYRRATFCLFLLREIDTKLLRVCEYVLTRRLSLVPFGP